MINGCKSDADFKDWSFLTPPFLKSMVADGCIYIYNLPAHQMVQNSHV